MAAILPDDTLINTNGADLSWQQLAALQMRADAGDASAAVALASMPKGSQYNAKLITKAFTPDKPEKKRKKLLTKAARADSVKALKAAQPVPYALSAQRVIDGYRHSDDPATREMAKAWYGR